MDLTAEEKILLNRLARFAVAALALGVSMLLARGRKRAGLTIDEAEAVVAWKARVDARFTLPTVVIGVVVFAGLVFGFQSAEQYRNRQLPAHLFFHAPYGSPPDYLLWTAPSALIALFAAAGGRRLLMRAALGSMQMRMYRRASNVTSGFDARRPVAIATALALPLALVWVVLALDWYCRVEADRIVVNRLWSIGETSYPYSDVALLVETSHWEPVHGTLRQADRFHIVFRDGTYWSYAGRADAHRPLVDHLERATGRRVVNGVLLEQFLPGGRQYGRR